MIFLVIFFRFSCVGSSPEKALAQIGKGKAIEAYEKEFAKISKERARMEEELEDERAREEAKEGSGSGSDRFESGSESGGAAPKAGADPKAGAAPKADPRSWICRSD